MHLTQLYELGVCIFSHIYCIALLIDFFKTMLGQFRQMCCDSTTTLLLEWMYNDPGKTGRGVIWEAGAHERGSPTLLTAYAARLFSSPL